MVLFNLPTGERLLIEEKNSYTLDRAGNITWPFDKVGHATVLHKGPPPSIPLVSARAAVIQAFMKVNRRRKK